MWVQYSALEKQASMREYAWQPLNYWYLVGNVQHVEDIIINSPYGLLSRTFVSTFLLHLLAMWVKMYV